MVGEGVEEAVQSHRNADQARRDSESDDPATAAKGRARLRALGQIA